MPKHQPETPAQVRRTVAVVAGEPSQRQAIRARLLAIPDVDIAELDIAALAQSGRAAAYDLVLLDAGSGELLDDRQVTSFRRAASSIPFVVISKELSPDRVRQLLQLNATDWLQAPFGDREFSDIVARHLKGTQVDTSDVYAFLPCVAGAGATTLAISAAAYLGARRRGKETIDTCLIDLDFPAGACGRYLDDENESDLSSIIANPDRIDLELLDIIKKDQDGAFSLFSFRRPELLHSPSTSDFVFRLLDVAAHRYRHVVIDLPPYPALWTDSVLQACDHALLVTEMNVPALNYCRDQIGHMRALGRSMDSVYVILNKRRTSLFTSGISRREIKKIFEGVHVAYLSDDWKLVSEALNRGVPPRSVTSRGRLVREFARAFGKIASERKPVKAQG